MWTRYLTVLSAIEQYSQLTLGWQYFSIRETGLISDRRSVVRGISDL